MQNKYIKKTYFLYFIFLTVLLTSLSSCLTLDNVSTEILPDKYSRLIVYLHLERPSSSEISFNLNNIQIENLQGGQWESLSTAKREIVSTELVGKQIKLSEVILPPGSYGRIKLGISDVSITNVSGRKTALTSNSESFYFDIGLNLKNKESHVLQLGWDPEGSMERGNTFEADIRVVTQKPIARGLSVFVSNKGSNYISIIDKDLERVVGAITVGASPMGMALNIDGARLYVVNSKDATLSVIDTNNQDIYETINLTSFGIGLSDVVYLPSDGQSLEGKLYIVNKFSNDVTVIDTGNAKVIKTIPVGLMPSNIALDKRRKELYVSNEGSNSVTIISGLSDSVSATIKVGHSPLGVAVGDDRVYVFCGEAGGIKVLSPSTRTITEEISTATSPRRGLVAYDGRFYVANEEFGEISLFDEFGVFIENIAVGQNPVGVAGDSVKERVYVTNSGDNSVSIIDPINKTTKVFLSVGLSPYSVVVSER